MRLTSLTLLATMSALAGLTGVAQAQQQPPAAARGSANGGTRVAARPLGPIVATAAESLGVIGGVRALPDGGVLVNDIARRRVVMLDGALANPATVIDSASGAADSYGPRPGGLVPYRGDSTLFVDAASLSMLVIDPAGKVARVMSVPRSDDAGALAAGIAGTPGFDAQGRLIYRGMSFRFASQRSAPGAPGAAAGGAVVRGGPGGPGHMPTPPDTMPIVRVDLATRQLDTLAWVKVPRPKVQMTQGEDGRMEVRVVMNPLPTVDEWAVTSDGALAIVRGGDYHVDWLRPDGSRTASAKLPFDWKRMTDEDKEAFVDSLKAARARQGANAPVPVVAGVGGGAGPGTPTPMVITRTEVNGPGGPVGGRSETRLTSPSNVEWVAPSELPDYRPPFFAGAVRADRDGNVWIRTTAATTEAGASVYDVVDRTGALVDRVQVPAGRTIVGFGADGTVLLASRDGSSAKLEKAKLR